MSTPVPSYEELAGLVVELAAQLERANGRIEALEAEVAALRAQLGKDSTNSQDPDRTERIAAPAACAGCGTGLGEDDQAGATWGQVWDILPVAWEKVHYQLPRRRCSCCRRLNTATPPFGQAGAVVYGPNLKTAAILLSW